MKLNPFIHCAAAGLAFTIAQAQMATPTTLPEVVITGKAEDLLGTAQTASKGQASAEEIQSRPFVRRGEILEIVPGVIITQHAGGGKANQYFLRGFNLDHGTDFAIDIDGMPVNYRTHAHGQGYADMNILIPELVEQLDYEKGPYTARNGDLSSAGAAHFKLYDYLPHGIASATWGEDNYWRGLIADSFNAGPGKLTLALEYNYYDGPWVLPEQFSRWNGLARWFTGDKDNHFSITAMGYKGVWQSSDQIPQRAIVDGRIPRLGYVDPRAGGDSQRYSLQLGWRRSEGGSTPEPGKAVGKSLIEKSPIVVPTIDDVWRANAYGYYYDLDLFSNFTYFLDDPERGDQFEQAEERWVAGGEAAREWNNRNFLGAESNFVLGVQTRHDWIDPIGLYKTDTRERFRTVREDSVYEGSVGIFAEGTSRWTDWFRTVVGVRGDYFWFDVASATDARNSGEDDRGLISPKLSMIFGPWAETELYLNAGTGFHSNDARGVNTSRDPETGEFVPLVDALVRTFGYEVGIRTQIVPKLTFTAALWWLDNDSELVYVGDAGTNEAGPGSRRYGLEVAAYYRPTDWLTLDAEYAATHARFRFVGAADRIPDSVPWMLNAGVTVGKPTGVFGSVRARIFEERPLIEDNTVQGDQSILFNGAVGYRTERWEVAVECLNIFDREDNDIEYFYTSRLPGEADEGIDDIHLHPTEPRTFRVRGTVKF